MKQAWIRVMMRWDAPWSRKKRAPRRVGTRQAEEPAPRGSVLQQRVGFKLHQACASRHARAERDKLRTTPWGEDNCRIRTFARYSTRLLGNTPASGWPWHVVRSHASWESARTLNRRWRMLAARATRPASSSR